MADITVGTEVAAAPFLKGIPASAAGSILYTPAQGDRVVTRVTRNNTASQTTIAAIEGGDGIHEDSIADASWHTEAMLNAAGDAHLSLFADDIASVSYACRDVKSQSGKSVVVNRTSQGWSGTFKIQKVTITEIGIARNLMPLFSVEASSVKFTFEDIIHRALHG